VPLSLSDRQLRIVMTAASLFPPLKRDLFLRSIANRLGDDSNPSDYAVERAVQFALNVYGISAPRKRAS
jgi:hypothetical protein